MDSLKQETQGLQKEKEVRFLYQLVFILMAFFPPILKIIFIVIVKKWTIRMKSLGFYLTSPKTVNLDSPFFVFCFLILKRR